jgi:hypothetical protein
MHRRPRFIGPRRHDRLDLEGASEVRPAAGEAMGAFAAEGRDLPAHLDDFEAFFGFGHSLPVPRDTAFAG